MQVLDDLSQNVHLLLERYTALQQENVSLRNEIERQRQELIRTHSELADLQQKNRRIATANGMSSAESAEEATKRINAAIARSTWAISALIRLVASSALSAELILLAVAIRRFFC